MAERVFTPGELLEISGGYWRTCALHAGVMLDVFAPLREEALTAGQLAGATGCEPRAMEMLANALAAMGLLVKTGKTYTLGESARNLLLEDSPGSIRRIIRHHHRLMSSWTGLPQTVRTGQPTPATGARSEEDREDFLMGMFNLAMAIAPRLAGAIDLSGRQRFLDLGGGPGTYAIQFCLTNPQLTATIYDLPGSRRYAEATIERFRLSERVQFMPGDFLSETLPRGYDVVWLSQVLHSEGPSDCQAVLNKAVKALKPGGLIFIHEFMLNEAMDGPEFPALFSLNMLLRTGAGQSYSEGQLREMLLRAGAKNVTRLDFTGPNDSGVLRAVAG